MVRFGCNLVCADEQWVCQLFNLQGADISSHQTERMPCKCIRQNYQHLTVFDVGHTNGTVVQCWNQWSWELTHTRCIGSKPHHASAVILCTKLFRTPWYYMHLPGRNTYWTLQGLSSALPEMTIIWTFGETKGRLTKCQSGKETHQCYSWHNGWEP